MGQATLATGNGGCWFTDQQLRPVDASTDWRMAARQGGGAPCVGQVQEGQECTVQVKSPYHSSLDGAHGILLEQFSTFNVFCKVLRTCIAV